MYCDSRCILCPSLSVLSALFFFFLVLLLFFVCFFFCSCIVRVHLHCSLSISCRIVRLSVLSALHFSLYCMHLYFVICIFWCIVLSFFWHCISSCIVCVLLYCLFLCVCVCVHCVSFCIVSIFCRIVRLIVLSTHCCGWLRLKRQLMKNLYTVFLVEPCVLLHYPCIVRVSCCISHFTVCCSYSDRFLISALLAPLWHSLSSASCFPFCHVSCFPFRSDIEVSVLSKREELSAESEMQDNILRS